MVAAFYATDRSRPTHVHIVQHNYKSFSNRAVPNMRLEFASGPNSDPQSDPVFDRIVADQI